MQLRVKRAIPTGPMEVVTEHKGQELEWNVASLSRTGDRQRARDTHSMFDEINALWAKLPPERLDVIWEGYCKAREIFDSLQTTLPNEEESEEEMIKVANRLSKAVQTLYEAMVPAEITQWRRMYSRIRIPPNLKEEYGIEDDETNKHQRSTTYLRSEYEDLVDYTIALRPMLPIWGEFVQSARGDTGNCLKEFYALRLIRLTWLVNAPACIRLKDYIDGLIERELKQHKAKRGDPLALMIMSGIPDVEFPWILLGMTLARRLVTSEISTIDDRSHLVTNLHQFITSKIKPNAIDKNFGNKKFGNKLAGKNVSNEKSEENQPSLIEMNKVKQQLADGDIMIIQHYASDPRRMLRDVDRTIPIELLELCLHHAKPLARFPVEPHHVVLVQFALASAIKPRGIRLLTKTQIQAAMAVAQAVYWAWGFHSLAALVTATPLPIDGESRSLGSEGTMRISKDLMNQLHIYPLHSGKRQSSRDANVATRAIESFSEMIAGYDWHINAPEELLGNLQRYGNTRRMPTPSDLQHKLAQFCIKIATS